MTTDAPLHWPGSGWFRTNAVGVSHYRPAIAAVVRNSPGRPALAILTLTLCAEENNPFDANAVGVYYAGSHPVAAGSHLGPHLGYLSRADAVLYRQTLAAVGSPLQATTVDAAITGGVSVAGRVYEYTIELDILLEHTPTATAPTYATPVVVDGYPPLVRREDGMHYAYFWLPYQSHDDVHRAREVAVHRGKGWSEVAFYLGNRQGIGYGERIYSVPVEKCLALFGTEQPDASIAKLDYRIGTLCVRPPD